MFRATAHTTAGALAQRAEYLGLDPQKGVKMNKQEFPTQEAARAFVLKIVEEGCVCYSGERDGKWFVEYL